MHNHQTKELIRIGRAIPTLRRRMEIGGTIEHVRSEANTVIAESEQHRAVLRGIKESAEVQYAHTYERWHTCRPAPGRPHPFHFETVGARWMRIGGYALIGLEALLTAWLSTIFLALPAGIAMLVGVVVAILLTLGAKGMKAFLIARYADTPIEARDRFVRWIIVAGCMEALLVVLLLYVRSSSDPVAVRMTVAFGGISALMSFTTMWLAGAMLACAELYAYSSLLAAVWERADVLEREFAVMERLTLLRIDNLGDLAAHGRLASKPGLTDGNGRRLARPLALVVGLAAASIAAAGQGSAQEPSCRAWVDASNSRLAIEMEATAHEIVRLAPAVSATLCGSTWEVLAFSDDAWSAMPHARIAWPPAPVPACEPPLLTEAEMLFVNARERRLADARRDCERLRGVAATRVAAAEARASAHLRSALAMVPARKGPCTAVQDLLARIAESDAPGVDIVASDMVESCGSAFARMAPPRHQSLIIVLVSRASVGSGSRAEDFERRRAAVLRAVPWARVVPPWGLAAALLESRALPRAAAR